PYNHTRMFTVKPSRFDLRFRVLGLAARVHWTFWFGGLFFVSQQTTFVYVLTGIAALFISIFVHEMGHALCGKHYGDRSPSIVLHGVGGYYTAGTINLRYGKKIWLCLWGPLAEFILGAIALGLFLAMRYRLIPFNALAWDVLWTFIWINLLWGVANLIPVYHLDAGQILLEVVRWKFPLKTDATAYTISLVVAILVVIVSLIGTVLYKWSLFPAVLFGFLGYQNYMLRKMDILTGGRYEEEMRLEPWERDADWW